MRSRLLTFAFSALLALSVAGAEFTLLPHGELRLPDGSGLVLAFRQGSAQAALAAESVEAGRKEGAAFAGTFVVKGNRLRVEETLQPEGGMVKYRLSAAAEKPVGEGELALECTVPAGVFRDGGMLSDGRRVNFPEVFSSAEWVRRGVFRRQLRLPLPGGTLTIAGQARWRVQDNRRYSRDEILLQIYPASGEDGRRAQLEASFAFTPAANTILPLGPAANRGFSDDAAEDGRGGWTDQGPANDMRALPAGILEFRGVRFLIADEAESPEKTIVALRGKARPGFPGSARIEGRGAKGKFLYLLNATAWEEAPGTVAGTVTVRYADGTVSETAVRDGIDTANFQHPRLLRNANIAYRGSNHSAPVGLYATCVALEAKELDSIELRSGGNSVWLVAAATVSDSFSAIEAPAGPVVFRAGEGMYFPAGYAPVAAGTILDLSNLLDAPAGKYGFLRAGKGRFEFAAKPGEAVRFYGTNLCQTAAVPPADVAAGMAEDIARRGYNLVRLHHFDKILTDAADGSGATRLRPEEIAKMDRLIRELRERGIYYTLDLFTCREIPSSVIPGFPEQRALTQHEVKSLFFLSAEMRKNMIEFSRNLLTHVNPHTGLAWQDDPALVTVGLVNEDTLSTMPARFPAGSFVAELFRERFREYCRTGGLPETKADGAYMNFIGELYRNGIRELAGALRSGGARQPFTDQNFHNNHSVHMLRAGYDYVDNHAYWGHPNWIGPKRWRLPAKIVPADSILSGYLGQFGQIATSRFFDKPFSVSEWSFISANRHAMAEGSIIAASFAGLQGWDMMANFAYSHTSNLNPRPLSFFDTASDPMRALGERAGVLLFRRGDVRESELSFAYLIPENYLDGKGGITSPVPQLPLLAMIGRLGCTIVLSGKQAELPPGTVGAVAAKGSRVGASVPVFPEEGDFPAEMLRSGVIPAECYDPARGVIRSGTGELTFYRNRRCFSVITPKSEGFVLPEGETLEGGTVRRVRSERSFSSLFFSAMDGRTLAESDRILILHLSDVKNSGERFRDSGGTILEKWGGLPLLACHAKASAEFARPLDGFRLHALGFDGKRTGEIPFEGNLLELDNRRNGCLIAAYELTKGE